ncbi:MAG: TIGR02147 family protein [Proteobacteria bacterium]|nr:MAG: TIGR02147 family protein [Pseudomonadota bacterium]
MALTKTDLKDIARGLKVTDFADFRAFLSMVYTQAKAKDAHYSYTQLSDNLGVGSTNAHGIISGKRALTLKAAEKIVESLGLTGVQKKYFLTLVKQERAKTPEDRDDAFEERMALRQKELPSELDRRQLAFFEHWYHAAILEILRLETAQSSAEWIAETIRPEVPLKDIKESLVLLLELGYLKFDEVRQRLFPTDATITTGNEVLTLALMSFHRQMLKLSVEALDNVARDDRDISAITITASPALKEQFKDELIALRKRFLQLSAEESAPTEVLQVNLQMFPLVKKKG